jgi:hypothetical protein
MDHPDKSAEVSYAESGEVSEKPKDIVSLVVKNKDQHPVGVFEKWNSEMWIYAEADSLLDLN